MQRQPEGRMHIVEAQRPPHEGIRCLQRGSGRRIEYLLRKGKKQLDRCVIFHPSHPTSSSLLPRPTRPC